MAKVEKAVRLPRTLEQNMGLVMRTLAACPPEQRGPIVRAVVSLYAPEEKPQA